MLYQPGANWENHTLKNNIEADKTYKFVLFADDEYTKVAECSVTY